MNPKDNTLLQNRGSTKQYINRPPLPTEANKSVVKTKVSYDFKSKLQNVTKTSLMRRQEESDNSMNRLILRQWVGRMGRLYSTKQQKHSSTGQGQTQTIHADRGNGEQVETMRNWERLSGRQNKKEKEVT